MVKIERRRLFDWRLVMSLILAGALLFGAFSAVKAIQAADAKDRNTATALAEVAKGQAQVHELIEQIKARDAEIQDQAVADRANTARFAANQAVMLRFQAEELAWTRRILDFVRTHPGEPVPASLLIGAPTPPRFQAVVSAPKATQRRGTHKHKGRRPGH